MGQESAKRVAKEKEKSSSVAMLLRQLQYQASRVD